MVLLTYFLHESDPRRDHQQIVLYSFCRSTHALHLAVKKYCFKSFCEDLSTLTLHTSVGYVPQNAVDRTLFTQPILLSENIPNI